MQRGNFRGHPTLFKGNKWFYEDTLEPLPYLFTAFGYEGVLRACKKCGSKHGLYESDPCLGDLPGVDNACCGHGIREQSYIRFENGVTIRGFEIEKVIE